MAGWAVRGNLQNSTLLANHTQCGPVSKVEPSKHGRRAYVDEAMARQDPQGWISLFADQPGADEALDMLLAAGADPNVRRMAGSTVLEAAAHQGNAAAVARLLAHGAHENAGFAAGPPLYHTIQPLGAYVPRALILKSYAAR